MSTRPTGVGDIPIGGGRRELIALMGAVGFGVFGIALAAGPGVGVAGQVIGILTALFFGPLGLWALVRSRRSPQLFILGPEGIRFTAWNYPPIPWVEVTDVHIVLSPVGQRFLAVDVADPDRLLDARGGRGRRLVRMNLRRGWGFMAIAAQQSPLPLEELAAEIHRRRPGAKGTAVAAPPNARGPRLLSVLALPESVVACHGIVELSRLSAARTDGRAALLAVFASLLLACAVALHYWPKFGTPLVVAVEAVLIALDLTLGHYTVAARILALFFPLCVLITLASRPPSTSHRSRS